MVSGASPLLGLGTELSALRSMGVPASGFRQIIERAQQGDGDAFDQLVVLHQRRVISTAWRLLGNQEDAFDVAQDVFLRLHRYLRSFRSDQDFGGWLYRMVVNACHDSRRRRGQHSSYEQERAKGTLAEPRAQDDVHAAAELRDDEALINRALRTLSPKEREALVLRDLEGLETEEVARALGSSATTVRSQISTARAKLRAFREQHLSLEKASA